MSRKVKDVVDWCGGPDRSGVGGGTFSFSLSALSLLPRRARLHLDCGGQASERTHNTTLAASATMGRNSLLLFSLSLSLLLILLLSCRVGRLSLSSSYPDTRPRSGGPVCAATLALTFHGRELEQRPRETVRFTAAREDAAATCLPARPHARTPPHTIFCDSRAETWTHAIMQPAQPKSIWQNSENARQLIQKSSLSDFATFNRIGADLWHEKKKKSGSLNIYSGFAPVFSHAGSYAAFLIKRFYQQFCIHNILRIFYKFVLEKWEFLAAKFLSHNVNIAFKIGIVIFC